MHTLYYLSSESQKKGGTSFFFFDDDGVRVHLLHEFTLFYDLPTRT